MHHRQTPTNIFGDCGRDRNLFVIETVPPATYRGNFPLLAENFPIGRRRDCRLSRGDLCGLETDTRTLLIPRPLRHFVDGLVRFIHLEDLS